MKRLGIGLIAAGALAIANFVTALPAAALALGGARPLAASTTAAPASVIPAGNNGGMIFLPPMGGRGMGGGMSGMRSGIGEMGRMGRPYPGTVWRGTPGGTGFQGGKVYRNGNYAGNGYRGSNDRAAKRYYGGKPGWNGNGWNGSKGWNGKHGWKGNGYYNGHYKGPRYRYRYPGYNYFYGGFWYPWPWWSVSALGGGYYNDGYAYGGGYGGSAHVEWCLNRYRSYDPRSNTYMGYDGRRHRCNSPFD